MSLQIVVQGTVKMDGTLELDKALPMPPGRVQVTVQPVPQPPVNDPFWARMEQLWAGQQARGHAPRTVEEVERERATLREESDQELLEMERIHRDCAEARACAKPSSEAGRPLHRTI